MEVIAPASERQVVRARVEERFLVRETGEMYRAALGPLAEEIRKDGRSIQWVYNILEHKKEAERIVFEDPDPATGFLLVPDPKWKTHPDPLAVPDRAAWRGAPWTGQLACLAICHDRGIGSLRDLRRRHLPLLRNILEQGLAAIERVYGVERGRVRVFVHYVPQFFHFHGAMREGGEAGSRPSLPRLTRFKTPNTRTSNSPLLPRARLVRRGDGAGAPPRGHHRQHRAGRGRGREARVLRGGGADLRRQDERGCVQTAGGSGGVPDAPIKIGLIDWLMGAL